MPSLFDLTSADASVDDQISAIDNFLRTLDPQPPVMVPTKPVTHGRNADLHRAKLLIDEAIDLLAPHFPPTP